MGLYHHIRNKDELLRGMEELILAEVNVPGAPSDDWREDCRVLFRALRAALLRHPSAAGLFQSTSGIAGGMIVFTSAVVGVMERAGFNGKEAVDAFRVLFWHTFTQARFECGAAYHTSHRRDRFHTALHATEGAGIERFAANFEYFLELDWGQLFEHGLDVIIAGLEAELYGKGLVPEGGA